MDMVSYLLGQNSAIKKGLKVQVVEELPTIGEENVLYLVPKQNTGQSDVFEEWIYINNSWEKIGTTDIDLSNYYTKSETIAKMSSMPTASADYVGTVVLYIGTTTSSYTNGRFYIGISTGEPATYSWSEMTVQDLTNYYTQTQVNNITGSLSDLTTTSKTNLVSAINELAGSGSPIQLLDIGNIQDVEPGYLDDNTILKTIYGDGKYGAYLIKAHINYNDSNAIIGIMFVGQSTSTYTLQQFLGLKRTSSTEFFSIMCRSIKNSDGTLVTGYKFMDTYLWLNDYSFRGVTFSSSDRHIARGKDIAACVGPKVLTNLQTTNKNSLVEAINEVNTGLGNTVKTSGNQTIAGTKTFSTLPQSSGTPSNNDDLVNKSYVDGLVGNINTVLATLTTPSNGGE